MRCHYVYDKEAGKVLIPGCWGVVHHYGMKGEMEWCTCRDNPETFPQFEKKEYNEKLKEKNQQIKSLEKENAIQQRIIKRLLKLN